jgi:hypothetical protein
MDAVFCSALYIYRMDTIVAASISFIFEMMAIVLCLVSTTKGASIQNGNSALGRSVKLNKNDKRLVLVAQVDVGWAEKSAEFSFPLTLLILSEAH